MNATATAEALGRVRKVANDGDVVRVTARHETTDFNCSGGEYKVTKTYTYACIWIAETQRWWRTGQLWTPPLAHYEFVLWLAGDEVIDIAVATAWEQVER